MVGPARLRSTWRWILAIAMASSCSTRAPVSIPPRHAVEPRAGTPARDVASTAIERWGPDITGFMALPSGADSLRWRLALIDQAKSSLEVQYYLWHADVSGALILDHLMAAAERGVAVRIIVDDFKVEASREVLAGLAAHPNLDLRLFNVFSSTPGRGGRGLEIVGKRRLNHRMHNKMLVADDSIAIVGGRNVGDEYSGIADEQVFVDMDVLVAGPAVPRISRAFDTYWNAPTASPAESLAKRPMPRAQAWAAMRERIAELLAEARVHPQRYVPDADEAAEMFATLTDRMTPGTTRVLFDDPDVGEQVPAQMMDSLRGIAADAKDEVLISSPYFVPDAPMMSSLEELTARGVRVVILTNSLATNDVLPVHTVYKQHRKPLLRLGAELYELRHDAGSRADLVEPDAGARWLALHAKLVVIDRKRVFVGTLNLDPRSMYLNTEFGIVAEAPALADTVARFILRHTEPTNAWRVELAPRGGLRFVSSRGQRRIQPARNFGQRLGDWVFGFLPLEGLI